MSKEDIIAKLREEGVEFNPNATVASLEKLLKEGPVKKEEKVDKTNDVLSKMMQTLSNIDSRISKLEGKESQSYRTETKSADVEKASETKKNLDPRIVSIVEESLGTDFGIALEPFEDKPGFLFTVIVPQRLSDNVKDTRPRKDEEGKYVTDQDGNRLFEEYFPEDRRSRAIGSTQSYDAVREHCDRVRSYIVGYYAKMKQPLPEFKVK